MHISKSKQKGISFIQPLHILISVFILVITSCNDKKLFKEVLPEHSHIQFNNQITETDSINVLDFENVYNGGGVGIGDFNRDGLQDIYFAGNMVSNKCYLNKGNFKFDDITEKAGVSGEGRWCRGVAVVDINNDGWQDIYVCTSIINNAAERQNLLYINRGLDKDKNPVFNEMAAEYGLNDTTHSTMASFFDYDNDGDLDVYIVVNQIIQKDFPNKFRPRMLKGEHPSTGRLYRNDWNNLLKHPVFINVSLQAGITIEGYGHNATVTDINKDGWKDILVSNDYLSQNILYINNQDGTFTDKIASYFKHTSANAMGSDVADINNDGLQDIIELDMSPEDNFRKKMMMNANSYQTYQNSDYFNIQYQYVRNTVQLNQGPRVNQKDSIGDPVFSDIAYFSGLAETDWSWTPLVVDFDSDGFRDVIITNGFPKDVTDHDFIAFRHSAYSIASKKQILDQIPAVKIHNYAFHNNGDLTFSNVTSQWGLLTPSFSNGAAYGDLDNDGDLDVVINNINNKAFIYENTLMDDGKKNNHYLAVKLKGNDANPDGIGTWIELYYEGKQQVSEQNPFRGYLSTIQKDLFFGLGTVAELDSLVIKWPNGKKQVLFNIPVDKIININIANANQSYSWYQPQFAVKKLFTEIGDSLKISYTHKEIDYIDFNVQKLLPHKFSEYGPALAVADIDGNGLDDIVAGGSYSYSSTLLMQQNDGSFKEKLLIPKADSNNKGWEDMGIALFDANGDEHMDIYIASGGYESKPDNEAYQDKLFINDGKGNFTSNLNALPNNFISKSCVRTADFDKDGDFDLFVAGRIDPWNYPKPVSSFIYRNDSKNGQAKFTDVTNLIAPALMNIGLVCDAVFTDFDNDGWQDLILAGEWMPLTFIKNNKGKFQQLKSEILNSSGWWTSLAPGDFDNDGDIDFIAGNLGQNSYYRANDKYPAGIIAKDFDGNGSYDAIPFLYLPESYQNPDRKEFPAHLRDDMIKQMISMRAKYQNYRSYALADMKQVLTGEQREGSLQLQANYFQSAYLRNDGKGKFSIMALPVQAQISILNGMVVDDFDGDGNLDVVINGNDFGTEVSVGRYDALNGLLLKGDGKGNFSALSILQSGIFIPGNGKSLVKLRGKAGNYLLAAAQNKGPLKIFELKKEFTFLPLQAYDVSVIIKYKNGKMQKREVNNGYSFLSQSGRFILLSKNMTFLEITNGRGDKRVVKL